MQRFDGTSRRQPDSDDPVVWPEPNDLSDWWLRVMTEGEQSPGKTGESRSWT